MTETTKLRVEKAVRHRLSLPFEIAEQISPLLGEWILQEGMIHVGMDRVRLTKDAKDVVDYVNRCLSWMSDQKKHHGQQATEIAAKTRRGLSQGNLTGKDLIAKCEEFHRVRHKHIRRGAEEKPRTEEWSVSLPSGLNARRLTKEKDLDNVGKQMKNCFANNIYGKEAKRQLRKGETEYIVIESDAGKAKVLFSFDRECNRLLGVKGVENTRPIAHRADIIETLRHRGSTVGDCADGWNLGIHDRFLGITNQKVKCFNIDGWYCEIAPGCLAMISGVCSILLGSNGYRRCGSKLIEVASASDMISEDAECFAYEEYDIEKAIIRCWLRESCRVHLGFAKACRQAFRDAPDWFVRDWFGHCHGPAPTLTPSTV